MGIALLFALALKLLPLASPVAPLFGGLAFLDDRRLDVRALTWPIALALVPTLCLLGHVAAWKGAAQLVVCLAAFALFATLRHPRLIDYAAATATLFAAAAIPLVPPQLLLGDVPGLGGLFYAVDNGRLRYDFVFSEPNHLAAFVYTLALVSFDRISQSTARLQLFVFMGLALTVAGTASPLSVLGFILYCGLYVAKTRRLGAFKLPLGIGAAAVILSAVPALLAGRLEDLLAGGDNSANFRTWGSVALAIATIEDEGRLLLGMGLGGARAVLDGNPYMELFAADTQNVLPSFTGSMMVEVGVVGTAIVWTLLLAILFRSTVRRHIFAAAGFELLNLLSGSFFYDSIAWSMLGLIANAAHRATSANSRVPALYPQVATIASPA